VTHEQVEAMMLADGARVAAPPPASLAVGKQVTVGIRPAHLMADAAAGIPASAVAKEPLGEDTLPYANVEHSGEQIVAPAVRDAAVARAGVRPRWTARARLSASPATCRRLA
jgi:ABC-type sugar transport system ATPase subunit